MTAVTAPNPRVGMDPRVRARRVQVRRAAGRRRLHRLVAVAAVLGVLTAAAGLALSPLLAVHTVTVRGAGPQQAAVIRAAGIHPGDPMVFVHSGRAAAAVEHLPWVASARVHRSFPNTVTITVTPRTPVAWADTGAGQMVVVDARGVVLARAPTAALPLPQLIGLRHLAAPGGRIAPTSPAAAAGALDPTLGPRVTTLMAGPQGLVALVLGGPQLRFGDPASLPAKAHAAAAVLGALVRPATYIDVSVPSAPVAG